MEEEKQQRDAVDASFTQIEEDGSVKEPEKETAGAAASESEPDAEDHAHAGPFERLSEQRAEKKAEKERERNRKNEEKQRKIREKEEQKAAKKQAKIDKKDAKKKKWEAGRKKRRRIFAVVVTILILVLVAGGAVYYHYVQYFRTHFYSGTTVNGTDVSYQTVDSVKKTIEQQVAEYVLTVKSRDAEDTLSAEEIGRKYVDDKKIDALMEEQDSWRWISHLSGSQEYSVSAGTTYDKTKVQEAVAKFSCLNGEITDPVDASLTITSDGTYEIVPETEGNRVDEEKLMKAVYKALDDSKEVLDIEKDDCYVHPNVYQNDEQLIKRCDAWNQYLSISISYKFGDSTETVDANMLKQYIRDNGETVTISTDWINALVYRWSKTYDTYGEAREFTTHDGNVITIPEGGDYGWSLNREAMIQDLTDAIENGESGAREPIWLFKAMGWDNGDITGTYVEISLESQKLYLYQNGQMIQESDIVTGTPGEATETKTGIYSIDDKQEQAVLSTADTQNHTDPVSWWCPFDGNQGIHDASWRSSFGGTVYQINGTNGSVNLAEDQMQKLYETVSVGTAVIVY